MWLRRHPPLWTPPPSTTALSTIAQCAAALAALIGFLGLWRLDRLREGRSVVEQALRTSLRTTGIPVDVTAEAVVSNARATVARQSGASMEQMAALIARWDALPHQQQRLMRALYWHLILTLTILALAIVGIIFVGTLKDWPQTPLLIVLASVCLLVGPSYVLREAARSVSAPVILALLLLTSPALAGPVRCTTYQEKTLGRLQTLCDDGTWAVSTYNTTLSRWESTVTPPPGKTCTGRLNPRTHQVEVRCR